MDGMHVLSPLLAYLIRFGLLALEKDFHIPLAVLLSTEHNIYIWLQIRSSSIKVDKATHYSLTH